MPVMQGKTVFILYLGKRYTKCAAGNTATHIKLPKVSTKKSQCHAQAVTDLYLGYLRRGFLSRLTASSVVEQPHLGEEEV